MNKHAKSLNLDVAKILTEAGLDGAVAKAIVVTQTDSRAVMLCLDQNDRNSIRTTDGTPEGNKALVALGIQNNLLTADEAKELIENPVFRNIEPEMCEIVSVGPRSNSRVIQHASNYNCVVKIGNGTQTLLVTVRQGEDAPEQGDTVEVRNYPDDRKFFAQASGSTKANPAYNLVLEGGLNTGRVAKVNQERKAGILKAQIAEKQLALLGA